MGTTEKEGFGITSTFGHRCEDRHLRSAFLDGVCHIESITVEEYEEARRPTPPPSMIVTEGGGRRWWQFWKTSARAA